MIDRPVEVVCTGYGEHRVVELFVLVPVTGRPDLVAMRLEAGIPEPPPTLDELRGFGVEGSMWSTSSTGRRRDYRKAPAELVDDPALGWKVVAPGCPRCHEPGVAIPVALLAARAQLVPQAQRVEVDVRPPTR